MLVPAQRQSYFDPDLFSDTDDDMSNNNEMRNGLAVGSSEGDQEQIFQVNSDWVSNWERVDEDVMKKWKFKSMGEAKDAASHTLFLNEYSFFGRKEKGSNGHFVCKRCSNQEGRGFKVKQKRNKGNPITFYTIELFGKHTEDCEAKREKDKVDNGCEVTVDKKSGAIKILNAVMKSPRYIERYKVLTAFNDPKSDRNTQNIQGRRHGKKGVKKVVKKKTFDIVSETFRKEFSVHLDFEERTYYTYKKKIDDEEAILQKQRDDMAVAKKQERYVQLDWLREEFQRCYPRCTQPNYHMPNQYITDLQNGSVGGYVHIRDTPVKIKKGEENWNKLWNADKKIYE